MAISKARTRMPRLTAAVATTRMPRLTAAVATTRMPRLTAAVATAAVVLLLVSSRGLRRGACSSQRTVPLLPPAPNGSQLLYVLRGSNATASLLASYQQMQRDLGADRVFLTFDDTHGPWPHGNATRMTSPRTPDSPHVLLFNQSEAEAVTAGVTEHMQYFEQPSLVLFYRHIGDSISYQHVWRLENDVRCNGNYSQCLAPSAALAHDLLCSWEPMHITAGANVWRFSQLGGALADVPMCERHGCFVPVMRISQRALGLGSQAMGLSSGYMEVFWSTLLAQAGMTMAVLPAESIGWLEYFVNYAVQSKQHSVPSTPDNRLYHPIKE
ncbi:glycosyl transferase family 2 [Chlorella sorokiniana]|uniref:Glycosyl transferase family 2 n=1 Tax=Chlorella sorokiniana TaxID=3076 RepID=A0A2P6TS00_CHLSO|nr:glycosyl transferase family 2 [Chlorella sorokiniana]|eukprot:PRW56832.1 glycosyl transferase family 2 [Chlorella sorokiniana]